MTISQKSKIATDVTRGSSALMSQRIAVTLMAIVYGAVLARLLGPVNIGLIALANSVAFAIGILSGVAVSGLKPAMIRNIEFISLMMKMEKQRISIRKDSRFMFY